MKVRTQTRMRVDCARRQRADQLKRGTRGWRMFQRRARYLARRKHQAQCFGMPLLPALGLASLGSENGGDPAEAQAFCAEIDDALPRFELFGIHDKLSANGPVSKRDPAADVAAMRRLARLPSAQTQA